MTTLLALEDGFVVIRADRDSIASLVSTSTGDVLFTYGPGSGMPTCAIYDEVGEGAYQLVARAN